MYYLECCRFCKQRSIMCYLECCGLCRQKYLMYCVYWIVYRLWLQSPTHVVHFVWRDNVLYAIIYIRTDEWCSDILDHNSKSFYRTPLILSYDEKYRLLETPTTEWDGWNIQCVYVACYTISWLVFLCGGEISMYMHNEMQFSVWTCYIRSTIT